MEISRRHDITHDKISPLAFSINTAAVFLEELIFYLLESLCSQDMMLFPKRFHCLILVTTVLLSGHSYGAPPARFHGTAQPSSLDSFFERAVSLVYEVHRLLDTAENKEDVAEYCVIRLENRLSNCVNLFEVIDRGLYNGLIDSVQNYIFFVAFFCSRPSGRPGVEESCANSEYNALIQRSNFGRPRCAITFDQLSFHSWDCKLP